MYGLKSQVKYSIYGQKKKGQTALLILDKDIKDRT